MAKTKDKKPKKAANGIKRELEDGFIPFNEPPAKKPKKVKEEEKLIPANLLDDSDGSDAEDGAAQLKVNEEYARRFEHNKKREEKQKLEEKYGFADVEDPDSEEGVEEDDAGEILTEALDADITATLQALRSKDPRIYKKRAKFYREEDDDGADTACDKKKEQSMTLRDYHTKNLLEGKFGGDDDEPGPLKTYAQEQEDVRQDLVQTLHAADSEEDEGDDFLVAKPKPAGSKNKTAKITVEDVENADKDPETFLSNFMASRAWVPSGQSHFQPLESDDEEEEEAAEEYENTYNTWFEDPTGANEKLVTYARDAVAKTTVRRDEKNNRRKARQAARAKRLAEVQQREEEIARLRKLKVEELEEKVQKIREIGGLTGRDFNVEEWRDVLEGDWSDDQWDEEMRKRFGENYYQDGDADSDNDDGNSKEKKKPKKPKFDDDIDIKDLVPDFEDDEDERPAFTLSDEEDVEAGAEDNEEDAPRSKKSSKQRKQDRADAKSAARRDRRLIENLVDDSLQYESALASSSSKTVTRFRYRETSPTTFGLTPRDILLADDKQLNEFAGLKKLAAFRDPVKKKKDKKHLSKKARLRQWRMETFGDADGPKGGFETLLGDEAEVGANGETVKVGSNVKGEERKKRKKRSRKKKSAEIEA